MGQQNSGPLNLEEEATFLAGQTNLTHEEISSLFDRYSKKATVTKKEFVEDFRKTFPDAMDTQEIARRVFETCDENRDGHISFREFAMSVYIMTKAPKAEKLKKIFTILDLDSSGTLSCKEVVQVVKQTYDILGKLNCDYHCKGIEIFRQMDANGDCKINLEEFLDACLKDQELCALLENNLGEKVLTGL